MSVSNDTTVDEKSGLIYGMQTKMNANTIRVNGTDVKLKPGMAVTAEVQTGYRRIIEFFMAPLLRARVESIR
jgi:hemolysin D